MARQSSTLSDGHLIEGVPTSLFTTKEARVRTLARSLQLGLSLLRILLTSLSLSLATCSRIHSLKLQAVAWIVHADSSRGFSQDNDRYDYFSEIRPVGLEDSPEWNTKGTSERFFKSPREIHSLTKENPLDGNALDSSYKNKTLYATERL